MYHFLIIPADQKIILGNRNDYFVSWFSVGGVMAFLTLHEMLPLAFDYAGQKQAVKAVFFGMAFMSAR